MRFALPVGLFVIIVAFLAVGLNRDPRYVPSPLIGTPLPAFSLTTLHEPGLGMDVASLGPGPYLINVWASWCAACRTEHPLLNTMARRGDIRLYGLNYKDERRAALDWLRERGDPYQLSLFDPEGRLGLDLGVYGVPETFVIGADGTIVYKHIGPLDASTIERTVLPLLTSGGDS